MSSTTTRPLPSFCVTPLARRQLLRGALGVALAPIASAASGRGDRSTLTVGFVADFAPFVSGDDAAQGILVDLAREALRRAGHSMRSKVFPGKRFNLDPLADFPELNVLVSTVLRSRTDYHYAPIYAFDNVAASLTVDQLRIDSVEDLDGKVIVAFNNAASHLKEPFTSFHRRRLRDSPKYLELERMESIVAMLLYRRAQVVMLDRVFLRHYARLYGHADLAGITVHELFPEKNTVHAITKDGALAAALRVHLEAMRVEGWTERLIAKYT